MSSSPYAADQGRRFHVVVGIISAAFGFALVGFVAFGTYRIWGRTPDTTTLVVLGTIAIFGLFLSAWGVRLVANRRRADGGLLSPWALRFGGMLFFVMALAFLIWERSWRVLEVGGILGAGVACFVLANRREEANQRHAAQQRAPGDAPRPAGSGRA